MLFVFRTLSFFVLGAILLTPVWLLNTRLDRLMPSAMLVPRADTANAQLRDRVVTSLAGLKREIHADMCRHDGRRLCLLTVCLPFAGAESSQCR